MSATSAGEYTSSAEYAPTFETSGCDGMTRGKDWASVMCQCSCDIWARRLGHCRWYPTKPTLTQLIVSSVRLISATGKLPYGETGRSIVKNIAIQVTRGVEHESAIRLESRQLVSNRTRATTYISRSIVHLHGRVEHVHLAVGRPPHLRERRESAEEAERRVGRDRRMSARRHAERVSLDARAERLRRLGADALRRRRARRERELELRERGRARQPRDVGRAAVGHEPPELVVEELRVCARGRVAQVLRRVRERCGEGDREGRAEQEGRRAGRAVLRARPERVGRAEDGEEREDAHGEEVQRVLHNSNERIL
jgi:hypothetical protein